MVNGGSDRLLQLLRLIEQLGHNHATHTSYGPIRKINYKIKSIHDITTNQNI